MPGFARPRPSGASHPLRILSVPGAITEYEYIYEFAEIIASADAVEYTR